MTYTLLNIKKEKIIVDSIKELVNVAVKGIQEKKGKGIRIIDLRGIDGAICQYFIVCEGQNPQQVSAIADSVEDMIRIELKDKPTHVVGTENALWIAMDYVDVMVHVFMPESRDFYNLETLWEDAPYEDVPDLD
jgi:ribosome-associated protein